MADHMFEGYDANPGICRHCGAVRPMPCYEFKTEPPVLGSLDDPSEVVSIVSDPQLAEQLIQSATTAVRLAVYVDA